MKVDRLRQYARVLLLGSGVSLLATGCGTTLRPLSPEKTAKLLSPRQALFVWESCSRSLEYEEQTQRLFVYRVDFDHERVVCNPTGPYELVLVIDNDRRIERYRLLRVK